MLCGLSLVMGRPFPCNSGTGGGAYRSLAMPRLPLGDPMAPAMQRQDCFGFSEWHKAWHDRPDRSGRTAMPVLGRGGDAPGWNGLERKG